MRDILVNKKKGEKVVIPIDKIDWSRIGYSKRPEYITRAIELARDIEKNWDSKNTSLQNFLCNTTEVNTYDFNHDILFFPSNLDISNVTTMENCFAGCEYLGYIPKLNSINCKNFQYAFIMCFGLKRIEEISFRSMGNIGNYPLTGEFGLFDFIDSDGYSTGKYINTSCRFMLIKDIGTNSACRCLMFSDNKVWGINSTDIPDAKQSLIDSLLTYSYDRRAAGYSDCKIILYKDVMDVLGESEKSAIQDKGYNLIWVN